VASRGARTTYVLGNQGAPRVAARSRTRQSRCGMLLLLTFRGTPSLHYGDELGMSDVVISPDRIQDPQEKHVPDFGLGRDPERTPMQWDTSPHAGFCPPDTEPWLPVAPDYQQVNVAVEREETSSILALTRTLLAHQRSRPALNRG